MRLSGPPITRPPDFGAAHSAGTARTPGLIRRVLARSLTGKALRLAKLLLALLLVEQAATIAPVPVEPWLRPGRVALTGESALAFYPRPANAFGLHDTPIIGGSQGVRQAIEHWRNLGVGWVTVLDPREELLSAARAAGIQVVGRVYSPSIHETGDLVRVTKRMVAYGMRYVVPYNEPNLVSETAGAPPDPVAFARRWVAAAEVIARYHGYPLLTPLAPEGDYPDLAYFERMLAEVVRLRGTRWLLDLRVAVGLHAYVLRPGDDFFERFHKYDATVRAQCGFSLPLLATEGGLGPDAGAAASAAGEEMLTIVRALTEADLPATFFGASLWLYANAAQGGRDGRFERAAWYGPEGPRGVFRAVQRLHELRGRLPADPAEENPS